MNGISEHSSNYFYNCTNLKSISLDNVTELMSDYSGSGYAFIQNCQALVFLSMQNLRIIRQKNYSSTASDLGNSPLLYQCNHLTDLTLPSLERVGNYFCSNNTGLERVSLPVITKMGYQCFQDCSSIETFDAPLLEEVGTNCFSGCSKVKRFNLPSLRIAPQSCFQNCSSCVDFGFTQLTTAGRDCFRYCSSIETLDLPMLEEAGTYCFSNCTNLKTLNIPNCKKITTYAQNNATGGFVYGTKIKELNLPELTTIAISERTTSYYEGSVFGRYIPIHMPKLQSIVTNLPLRCYSNGLGTSNKTGWNNYTANDLETIDILRIGPFYYESDLTWVDFPVLRELTSSVTGYTNSSLFNKTGLKRFWLPRDTIQRIDASSYTQSPFYGLEEDFEIWTDFTSEDEINEANTAEGTLKFGEFWNYISQDQKATVQYGKTHNEYREEVARLDGGTIKPEFSETLS